MINPTTDMDGRNEIGIWRLEPSLQERHISSHLEKMNSKIDATTEGKRKKVPVACSVFANVHRVEMLSWFVARAPIVVCNNQQPNDKMGNINPKQASELFPALPFSSLSREEHCQTTTSISVPKRVGSVRNR